MLGPWRTPARLTSTGATARFGGAHANCREVTRVLTEPVHMQLWRRDARAR